MVKGNSKEQPRSLAMPLAWKRLRRVTQAAGAILAEVARTGEWVMASRSIGMGLSEYEDRQARQRAYEEREYLRQLKRCQFIKTKRIGKKILVRLTAKGWQQVLRDKIRATTKQCRGGICFVIFDVPESEHRIRDVLRSVLIGLGFKMIQKSVWATDKDILKELCALLQGANLHQWVRIVQGKEVQPSFMHQAFTRLSAVIQDKKKQKVI